MITSRSGQPARIAAHLRRQSSRVAALAAAQDAGTVRRDLDIVELMSLTTAVARAGSPAQADRFLSVLLDGVVPR
ncbi:hypothetical protein [Catenulispora pinistramenti]|uniref:SbtR family transcriptional regulator n=1 Tax=Catenulispora pinistramenti TaxID=2705254 RepID=UPI0027DC9C6E|nr:hypothetical protein [Catenulispora pinistramenti]